MIGIIGAMEDEIVFLRNAMLSVEESSIGNFKFFTGKLENKDAVLLRCGICKVNAAVGAALLINTYNPSVVINTGSAGGIDPRLKFGDAVIADGLVYHDVDVTAFNYVPGQVPGSPPVFQSSPELILKAEKAVNELKEEKVLPETFNYVQGIIASGDIFVHQAEVIERIRRDFPDVRAVEMESTAIAQTCALFSVPFLIIRALSDIAGSESPLKFNEFLPIASKHSAEIVRRIVKRL